MTESVSDEPSGSRVRRALRRAGRLPRWWAAALCVLLGVLSGASYGMLRTVDYTATSYIAVVPAEGSDPLTTLGLAQAYGRVATGAAVLNGARWEAGVPVSALRSSVTAATSPDAPMIEVSGTADDAYEAARVTNAVAGSLIDVAEASAKATGVELTVFSTARAPRSPSSPSAVLTTAVGGSAGVLVGALLLLVRPRGAETTAFSAVPAPATAEGAGKKGTAKRKKEVAR